MSNDAITKPAARPRVLLGHVTGVHGIRGEIVVRSHTADPADIAAYGTLERADGRSLPALRVVRVSDKGVIARLEGVTDRTKAETFAGTELWVDRARLPVAVGEEFYHADLIGIAAVAPDGMVLGEVISIANFGAGDLLELKLASAASTEFIPFTRACVPKIDLAARRIVIVLPDMIDGEPGGGDAVEGE